ncbi:serine protease [Coprinellus micaceus]|uniref:Serine protease n=1 Tax=Coprinellus micaceus TaxID=71717 RepID=A0A4Y7TU68_COPMI|nr:serine protease [Coprinellus micaceus]
MRFLTVLCTICTVLPVFAGPTLVPIGVSIEIYPGEKAGGHIVRLEDGAPREDIVSLVTGLLAGKPGNLGITHEYDAVFSGFAGRFDPLTLAALQITPGVASITEDGIVRTTEIVTQRDAPWGLARLSSKSRLAGNADALDYAYHFDSKAGEGIDIYIIDTGIRTSHQDFGGRAEWSYPNSESSAQQADGNGHGTHCAGTAAGGRYGVAKKAKIYAVKVLSDDGTGTTSDVIAGMNHVIGQKKASGRPTVASMSLGGLPDSAMDSAAEAMVRAGVHLVVAAGNSYSLAETSSPARVKAVITVGASDIKDARATFSNFGPVVDVFAPGVDITSAWNTADNGTAVLSGTSMATPHIAGLVAYLLSLEGEDISPAVMSQRIKDLALKGQLTGIPPLTANRLAYNGLS